MRTHKKQLARVTRGGDPNAGLVIYWPRLSRKRHNMQVSVGSNKQLRQRELTERKAQSSVRHSLLNRRQVGPAVDLQVGGAADTPV